MTVLKQGLVDHDPVGSSRNEQKILLEFFRDQPLVDGDNDAKSGKCVDILAAHSPAYPLSWFAAGFQTIHWQKTGSDTDFRRAVRNSDCQTCCT